MRKLSDGSLRLLAFLSTVLLIQFSFSQVSATTCIEKEREALLQLKKSFIDPSHRLASWKGTDCCNWDGVGCNETTGHVTKLDLRNNSEVFSHSSLLIRSIDSNLLELKYLNYLDLSKNEFYFNQIPNFLGSMLQLRYLNLSGACFSEKIPPHIGNLTKLVVLDLSSDGCFSSEGEKPHSIGDVECISRLSSLKFLGLGGMNFSEASNLMQVLSSLPLLSSLRLTYCCLRNVHLSLDSFNSSFITRIQLLDLSSNDFNGPIPKTFENMTSLRSLYLYHNQFTTIEGGLSSFIGNNCLLKEFDLSDSYYLVGDVFGSYKNVSVGCDLQLLDLSSTAGKNKIPNWLGMFKHLQSLHLVDSSIYGPIPTSLGNLSNIQYLDLSYNDISGAIPTSFGRLFNLRSLNLRYNRLEAVGVECFGQLESLEELDISHNLLKGVVTEAHFANLSWLHTLRIDHNELLSLDMKSNWVPPFQLNILDASSCIGCFGRKFPQWLQTQTALIYLLLSNTSISGALPTGLRAQNLTTLDLSHNQIVGPLPTRVGDQMPNLKGLILNNNLINGSLPSSACKLKHLKTLDLSHNQIMGPLPTIISDQMPNLEYLSLNNNLINGSLPPSICKWKNLKVLDVSKNRLSGTAYGCLLTSNLVGLDLSFNNFSEAFPYSLGNSLTLEKLYLSNNNFEGSMPIVLKNSKYLLVLDLEGNHFSGNIPTWVGYNLQHLELLKLRSNRFDGTIPSSLCLLSQLQILDLAHNQLRGNIPPNLSNFGVMTGKIESLFSFCHGICRCSEKGGTQYLKSRDMDYSFYQLALMMNIDLSNNSLVGFIPSEITTLKKLVGLNLSHNNLTGTIPIEMGAIKSLESLDLSFNQLSGPIPNSMSKLNSLGALRLSHNNLSGNIPQEGHLSTFNEASSFDDNPFLCGDPLPVKCVIEKPIESPREIENLDQEDKWEKWLLYIMIILGYVTGFWAVVGVLVLKRSWRYAYFKFVMQQGGGPQKS